MNITRDVNYNLTFNILIDIILNDMILNISNCVSQFFNESIVNK